MYAIRSYYDLKVDGYFLEYDDPRSGNFEPLRYLPKGKTVVLGLVTTKLGELESKDMLNRITSYNVCYTKLLRLRLRADDVGACRRAPSHRERARK